jgi:hypothetical protein
MPTTTARDRLGRRARFASAVVVLLSAGLFVASLLLARDNRLPTGGGLGADYLAFYDAGTLLRRYGPARLYDLPLQSAAYHARLPGEPPEAFLPYAYAPHVAAFFAVLSTEPYAVSYTLWTALSVAAYAVAVAVAVRAAELPRSWWPTAAWLAAGFEPFAFECVHGGQISTVAVALLSTAAMLSIAGRPLTAGVVAGCCVYKPTLLVILLPALVLTRRWRTLAGCAASMLAWAAIDLLAFGLGPCRMYLNLLLGYTGHSALDFRVWKFVDVHAFVLLLGGSPGLATAAVLGVAVVALIGVRRQHAEERPSKTAATPETDDNRLFWATVLAWTPVANLYAGAYDAVLVVPAAILTADVIHRRCGRLPMPFVAALYAAWGTPLVTSGVAQLCGLQMFTVALAAMAVYVSYGTGNRQPQRNADSACKMMNRFGPVPRRAAQPRFAGHRRVQPTLMTGNRHARGAAMDSPQ